MANPLVESRIAESANASAVADEAKLRALVASMHENFRDTIKSAVREEMSPERGRYLDISRVPLICQALIGLDEKMDHVVTQDQFWPVKTLVYGFVGIILMAVVGALVALVIIQR